MVILVTMVILSSASHPQTDLQKLCPSLSHIRSDKQFHFPSKPPWEFYISGIQRHIPHICKNCFTFLIRISNSICTLEGQIQMPPETTYHVHFLRMKNIIIKGQRLIVSVCLIPFPTSGTCKVASCSLGNYWRPGEYLGRADKGRSSAVM